ncbi:hypothetical protein NQ314_015063 [Rhamnusium bicolor]|uniref:Uncharacterized protein n=1 Tax=Rhamnusium bicolor TaxID=1586634 RepID=A0AAV8WZT3_9CUCU|nr:hypothetical protein NQ314_015063 [Rhamnusium bicolor]
MMKRKMKMRSLMTKKKNMRTAKRKKKQNMRIRKKESKKEDKKSDESDDDDDGDEDEEKEKKRDKDKRKKERVKLYTKDRHLLLSFIYFDQTHCGYIFDKDIEDLLYTLGLKLSRAQVRKLVSKVVTRDSLHYRKLTDKPREDDFIVIDDSEKDANLHELALGNKRLLPIFVSEETIAKRMKSADSAESTELEDGFVMFRGSLVDVNKLMSQLERSERARIDTEARMVELKNENQKLSEKYTKSNSSIKHLNSEVKDYKEKLRNTEDSLIRVTAYSKLFQTTLIDIRDKIDPVLKSTSHKEETTFVKKDKDDKDKDKKHEENKSRWEKEVKKGRIE